MDLYLLEEGKQCYVAQATINFMHAWLPPVMGVAGGSVVGGFIVGGSVVGGSIIGESVEKYYTYPDSHIALPGSLPPSLALLPGSYIYIQVFAANLSPLPSTLVLTMHNAK